MAYKRSRTSYEHDVSVHDPAFVTYGTPLPPLDAGTRYDGSYVPLWKQEVTDERGRKRLHGAFTGGFSAGYFNTVGSKEGWTPSTFVSSRTNRRKDGDKHGQQRPEDFMDEEDLAEAAEAQRLQTNDAFSALGSTGDDEKRRGFLLDLFKADGETMGMKLLRKMGWRDGQGIGPRLRRKAQVSDDQEGIQDNQEEHLFAPINSAMITFVGKDDQRGLGFIGEDHITPITTRQGLDQMTDLEDDSSAAFDTQSALTEKRHSTKPLQGGIGVGVLNDAGSDDDDPYEMGPRISYNRTIGGDKKKAKTKGQKTRVPAQAGNPLLSAKPVFMSKKTLPNHSRKCNDGRLPLHGFVLFDSHELMSSLEDDQRWPRPKIPLDWKSSRLSTSSCANNVPNLAVEPLFYSSTSNAARISKLDPKARAAILGEAQLSGKSVFDFLSTTARDRIAAASGKHNLPAALGEIPTSPSATKSTSAQSQRSTTFTSHIPIIADQIPDLDKDIALAALGRGVGGWTPYADNPAKLARYRCFLEYRGGITVALPPTHRPSDMPPEAWLQELREFAHAAQVFRPMTGMMASRFTSSSTAPMTSTSKSATTANGSADDKDDDQPILLQTPAPTSKTPKIEDPAEAAAKMGMFGPMTRSMMTFYPSRLVCKRFGVKPPPHVQADSAAATGEASGAGLRDTGSQGGGFGARGQGRPADLVSKAAIEEMVREVGGGRNTTYTPAGGTAAAPVPKAGNANGDDRIKEILYEKEADAVIVDTERNEALEGNRAGDAVFKAIFGSDDEDD